MIELYKKKPLQVLAIQLTENNLSEVINFLGENIVSSENFSKSTGEVFMNTLEGIMCASIGDYIIKGVEDEFYPCKESVFLKTYNKVVSTGK